MHKNKMRKQTAKKLITLLFGLVLLGLFWNTAKPTYAAGPNLINFQGKVVNADGTNVTNGAYNFDFVLYDDPSLGSPSDGVHDKWHELTKSVTVTNGVFQTNLGSVTTLPDFNANPALYLAIRFNADAAGYMSPRVQLTSVPYALNADNLGGLTSSNFVKLAQGVQADSSTTNPSISISKTLASDVTLNGLDFSLTDNAAASTGTLYGLSITNADNGANVGVPDAIAYLKNANAAETVPDGLLIEQTGAGTLTSGLEVKQTAGAITNGLKLTGTFTNLISATNFSVTNAGALTAVGINSGTGLIQGTGGLTITGAAVSINASSNFDTSINTGTSTGTVTIGNSSSTALKLGKFTTANGVLYTSATDGTTAETAASTGAQCLQTSGVGTAPIWGACGAGGSGVTTVGAFSASSQINGANITGSTITFGPADATNPGMVSTGSQTFNGAKIFQSTTASNNAFQIQNTTGLDVANVNTNTTPNLIANPSLEINANGWSKKGAAGVAITSSDEVAAQYGSRELKIVTTASIGDGATFNFQPAPSTVYSITFWAKSTASTGANISFGHRENTTTGDVDCLTGQTLTTTWTQFTCNNFTTNATVNDTVPTIGIYVKQSDATARTIYLDGVTMVQAVTGLTFDAGGNNLNINNSVNGLTFNATNSGELTPWQLSTNGITVSGTSTAAPKEDAATITSNGFIYMIGGFDGTNTFNSVYYAKMNADGSVGTWQCQGTAAATSCGASATGLPNANSLPTVRRYAATTVANGYLYVIGGVDATPTAASTVYYAKLNSDGTTGTWQTNAYAIGQTTGSVTVQPRVAPSLVVSNGFIYALGGCSDNAATCGTPSATTYYAKLNADGSVGAWTSTGALSQARGMGVAVFANGNIYFLGGRNTTGVTTVDKSLINSDGSLPAFAATTALPANRQEHSSVVANGYVYVLGGSDGAASPARQSTVYYAKLNSDGTTGAWNTMINALPAGRSAASGIIANGYVYVIGGCGLVSAGACSTNQVNSVYYASTPRILVGGSLDLVGLTSQTLTDFGGGGALTAGNGRFIGDLKVDGYVDLNNGLSVDSAINLNAVSGTQGQVVFNINNSSTNSIFNVKHLAANFGAAATTGAFISRNSYWGEEFNVTQTNNCSATTTANAWKVRGDNGNNVGTACTAGNGELAFSRALGVAASGNTSAACTSNSATTCGGSVPSANYGLERISATSSATASNTAASLEYIATTAAGGTASAVTAANNLPVFTTKVKPSLVNSASNARFFVGLGNKGVASGLFPANGIFFSNCTATGTPACTNTNWIGVVTTTAGGVVGTVSCTAGTETGTINTTNFNYLRIEVRSNTDIHFFVDTNTATGINEVECGTGITGTGPAATGLSPMFESAFMTNTATTENLDIDFVRMWQDDPPLPDSPEAKVQADNGVTNSPLTIDSSNSPEQSSDVPASADKLSLLPDFMAATSEDTVFNKNVYVKGTLYADKIKANQIEGLQILTDKISSLQDQLAKDKTAISTAAAASTPSGQPAGTDIGSGQTFSNLNAINLVALAQIESKGGLVVDKDAQFNGKTIFQLLTEFNGPAVFHDQVSFDNQPTFNSDAGGIATLKKDSQRISVKFGKEYAQAPIVVANWLFDDTKDSTGQIIDSSDAKQQRLLQGSYSFSVANITTKGFDIILNKKAAEDLKLNWIAMSIKDAKITDSTSTTQ